MRYYTADTHFGDNFAFRGYATPALHDEAIIDGINRTVARNDVLYIIGDVGDPRRRCEIRCKHIFVILGNHDTPKKLIPYFGVRGVLGESHRVRLMANHRRFHFPAPGTIDGRNPRSDNLYMHHFPHAYWPDSHYGAIHLYGHVHGAREETLYKALPHRRSLDAGVDNAKRIFGDMRPFSEAEIVAITMGCNGHDKPSFYYDTQGAL